MGRRRAGLALWTRWHMDGLTPWAKPLTVWATCFVRRHKAVVEYLESFGGTFADSAAAMRREAGIGSANCKGEGPRANLLARKWTVIARLQKQVTELEARLAEGGAGAGLARPTRKDFLPMRAPQHTLSGHRGAVLVRRRTLCRSVPAGSGVSPRREDPSPRTPRPRRQARCPLRTRHPRPPPPRLPKPPKSPVSRVPVRHAAGPGLPPGAHAPRHLWGGRLRAGVGR